MAKRFMVDVAGSCPLHQAGNNWCDAGKIECDTYEPCPKKCPLNKGDVIVSKNESPQVKPLSYSANIKSKHSVERRRRPKGQYVNIGGKHYLFLSDAEVFRDEYHEELMRGFIEIDPETLKLED